MELAVAIGLDTVSFLLTLLLVALGLIIIFGLMNVINMAHGEFFLLGAYTVIAVTQAGGSFWLAVLLAPVVLAVFGLAVEELVIRHVYHRFIDTILATWGLSLAIKQAVIVIFGATSQSVGNPMPGAGRRPRGHLPELPDVHHRGDGHRRERDVSLLLSEPSRPDGAGRDRQSRDGELARHQHPADGPGHLRLRRRARRLRGGGDGAES